jgi:hypothetical protein
MHVCVPSEAQIADEQRKSSGNLPAPTNKLMFSNVFADPDGVQYYRDESGAIRSLTDKRKANKYSLDP